MSESENRISNVKPRISKLAILSLVLSICAAICLCFRITVMPVGMLYHFFWLELISGVLSSLFGIAALIQRWVRYHRLWRLALVAIGIWGTMITFYIISSILSFLIM
jgi:hypothetical protein